MENNKNRDYGHQNHSPQQKPQNESGKNSGNEGGKLSVEKDHTVESRLNSENSDPNIDTDEESLYKKGNTQDECTTTDDINNGNLTAVDIERDLVKKGFNKDDTAGTDCNRYL
jgi:hypothetical protein